MSSRLSVLSCALAALVVATGCSRQEESTPCVATPSLTLARDRAAIGSPLKVTYTFDVAQNATIGSDHVVFVHVLDDQGEALSVADQVDDALDLTWLGVHRCDLAQGAALRRPVPADQLAAMIAELRKSA